MYWLCGTRYPFSTYNVDWTSSQAGEHEIAVTLDGAPVGDGGMGVCNGEFCRGSEIAFVAELQRHARSRDFLTAVAVSACAVVPGDLEASECSCNGNGLKTARAGEEAAFFVTAADCYGNLRLLGGDDIAALVYQGGIDANHDGKPARLNDLGDGRSDFSCLKQHNMFLQCYCRVPLFLSWTSFCVSGTSARTQRTLLVPMTWLSRQEGSLWPAPPSGYCHTTPLLDRAALAFLSLLSFLSVLPFLTVHKGGNPEGNSVKPCR